MKKVKIKLIKENLLNEEDCGEGQEYYPDFELCGPEGCEDDGGTIIRAKEGHLVCVAGREDPSTGEIKTPEVGSPTNDEDTPVEQLDENGASLLRRLGFGVLLDNGVWSIQNAQAAQEDQGTVNESPEVGEMMKGFLRFCGGEAQNWQQKSLQMYSGFLFGQSVILGTQMGLRLRMKKMRRAVPGPHGPGAPTAGEQALERAGAWTEQQLRSGKDVFGVIDEMDDIAKAGAVVLDAAQQGGQMGPGAISSHARMMMWMQRFEDVATGVGKIIVPNTTAVVMGEFGAISRGAKAAIMAKDIGRVGGVAALGLAGWMFVDAVIDGWHSTITTDVEAATAGTGGSAGRKAEDTIITMKAWLSALWNNIVATENFVCGFGYAVLLRGAMWGTGKLYNLAISRNVVQIYRAAIGQTVSLPGTALKTKALRDAFGLPPNFTIAQLEEFITVERVYTGAQGAAPYQIIYRLKPAGVAKLESSGANIHLRGSLSRAPVQGAPAGTHATHLVGDVAEELTTLIYGPMFKQLDINVLSHVQRGLLAGRNQTEAFLDVVGQHAKAANAASKTTRAANAVRGTDPGKAAALDNVAAAQTRLAAELEVLMEHTMYINSAKGMVVSRGVARGAEGAIEATDSLAFLGAQADDLAGALMAGENTTEVAYHYYQLTNMLSHDIRIGQAMLGNKNLWPVLRMLNPGRRGIQNIDDTVELVEETTAQLHALSQRAADGATDVGTIGDDFVALGQGPAWTARMAKRFVDTWNSGGRVLKTLYVTAAGGAMAAAGITTYSAAKSFWESQFGINLTDDEAENARIMASAAEVTNAVFDGTSNDQGQSYPGLQNTFRDFFLQVVKMPVPQGYERAPSYYGENYGKWVEAERAVLETIAKARGGDFESNSEPLKKAAKAMQGLFYRHILHEIGHIDEQGVNIRNKKADDWEARKAFEKTMKMIVLDDSFKTKYIKSCVANYFETHVYPGMSNWSPANHGKAICGGDSGPGTCGWGLKMQVSSSDIMQQFAPSGANQEKGLYPRWKRSRLKKEDLSGPWTAPEGDSASWKVLYETNRDEVEDQIKNKKKEESMRNKLKNIIKEVISENRHQGYSDLQDAFPYNNSEEEKGEELNHIFNNYLTQFDNDPGFDTAVRFGKCFVHNKEMLRDILEMISSIEELKEEFIEKMKKLDVV